MASVLIKDRKDIHSGKAEQRLEAVSQGMPRLAGKFGEEGFSPRGPADILIFGHLA